MDDKTTISTLKKKVIKFRDKRNWKQFHDPKNLAMALSIEIAELQETMLWKSNKEVGKMLQTQMGYKKVQEELADILVFLLYLSEACNIDLSEAVMNKIAINDKKYPVVKSFNSHKKYTDL
jgi:NTP pyrophosphatase (non-canonical NTP hydrolase)